jgi:hypothetical protein
VFGVNDGLVSNTSLVMGFAGSGTASTAIAFAGLAGLLTGQSRAPTAPRNQEISRHTNGIRYITPLVVAARAAAAIVTAPAAMAADTGGQSCSAAPGVIDRVCVTPEMLRSTTPHRFSSVRSIPTGRAGAVTGHSGVHG